VLFQHVLPQVNAVLGIDAQDAPVVGAMVDLSQGQPIGDFRRTHLVTVGENDDAPEVGHSLRSG
jgi:hypothetical protein